MDEPATLDTIGVTGAKLKRKTTRIVWPGLALVSE
jgi:hypothetical protein